MKMKQKLEKTLGEPKSNKFDWFLLGRHGVSYGWHASTVASDM